MTMGGAPAQVGQAHDDIRIAHIRHGELVVVLELSGEGNAELANRNPRDTDLRQPDIDIHERLIEWLEGMEIPLCHRGGGAGNRVTRAPMPMRRYNGEPRLLQVLPGDGEGPLTALMTVNLGSWEANPWGVDKDLSRSILEVAHAVQRVNGELARRDGRFTFAVNGIHCEVVGVAPNWIGTGGNGCACGGPGGQPVGPSEDAVTNYFFQREDVIKAANCALERLGDRPVAAPGQRGAGVTIAVIDSWPVRGVNDNPVRALDDKIKKLGPKSAGGERLGRLRAVLSPKTFDNVIRGEPELGMCIHRHGCDGPLPEKMDFANHGLFVAGILHEIAPAATLRIYRAFNDHGCSTADLITTAVRRAVYDARHVDHQPLVINCSFSVGPETHMIDDLINFNRFAGDYRGLWALAYKDGEIWIDKVGKDRPQAQAPAPGARITIRTAPLAWVQSGAGESGVPEYQAVLSRLLELEELKALHRLFGPLPHGSVLPVAAAGNDSCRCKDPDHPRVVPPRFPAAFPEVFGVSAAIPCDPRGERWEPAEYSNNDDIVIDRPDGVSAMGGKDKREADSDEYKFLIGPYVSDMPDGNDFGHALWAGTSFSTPVVAALAACVWSEDRVQHPDEPSRRGTEIMRAIVGTAENCDWTPGAPERLVRLLQRPA